MAAEKFTRKRLLGSGGMGEVWLAWDGALGRWVALKFLKGGSAEDLARFQREAQIASRLNHPGIAAIYEVGPKFIAMQFVEGQTLKNIPRKDRAQAVGLIRDAARAVHFAHEQGIIHRDLKPDNLMVTRDGHLFVMDFGLARPMEGRSDLSESGLLVGTPNYMPPEQARGDRVDGRSDVYSLGATLYQLITGRLPIEGKNPIDILHRVVEEDPTPPRKIDPRIDADLETIVLKCLEKERADRYATAEDLANDLERYLQGEPIAARGPSPVYRMARLLRKRRAMILAGAAGLVIAAVVAAIVVPGLRKETEARQKGEKAISIEKKRAEALADLGTIWAQVLLARQGLYKEKESARHVTRELREAVGRVSDYIRDHPEQPQGYYIRAKGWLYLGETARAEKDLDDAISRDASFVPGSALLVRVLFEKYIEGTYQGYLRGENAAHNLQAPLLRRAREILAGVKAAGDEALSPTRWGLTRTADDAVTEILTEVCVVAYVDHQPDRALQLLQSEQARNPSEEYCRLIGCLIGAPALRVAWFSKAIEIMPHGARAYLDRGNAVRWTGDDAAALKDYARAIEENPEFSMAYENRGALLEEAGRLSEAMQDFEKAIELDPRGPSPRSNRGLAYLKAQKYDEAIEEFGAALALDPEYVVPMVWRGYAYFDLNRFDAALSDFARAIEIDPEYAEAYNGRGLIRLAQADLDGAVKDFTTNLRFHPNLNGYVNRANALSRMKNFKAALADYSKALAMDPSCDEARRGQEASRQELEKH